MKTTIKFFVFAVLFFVAINVAYARDFNYQLSAKKVADNTYVFVGKTEDFSFSNGGNIVNTGFIVTSNGVVVIDTGPSLRYGMQMKEAISKFTDKKIIAVYLTHHHPDHFLGNQAFIGIPIYALAGTVNNIKNEGAAFTDNLYLMVGDWMRGTDAYEPTQSVEPGIISIGGHDLEIFSYEGHTNSDMAILDHSTGVLFSGDLVFHNRTLTTPHANIAEWKRTLMVIKRLPFTVLVPGHGAVSKNKDVLDQVLDYLTWLDMSLTQAAESGLSMAETMEIELPKRFMSNTLLKMEFSRSIIHLYTGYENKVFARVN